LLCDGGWRSGLRGAAFDKHDARGGKQPGTAHKDEQMWLKGQLHKMTPTRQALCREALRLA